LSEDKVHARLQYKDLVFEVSGDPDSVIKSIIKWLTSVLPAFDVFDKLSVDIDYVNLSRILSDYVMLSGGGEIIFRENPPKRLPLSSKILIALGVAKLSYIAGKTDSPSLSLRELTAILGKPSKTISSRLSELHYDGYVKRFKTPGGVAYEITVKGLIRLMNI